MLSERAIAICLLEILREFSDDEHIMARREIESLMERQYGLHPDRRTIYGAISVLMELGYDVSTYEDNGIGYCLRSREFDPSQIVLLTDAVRAFSFITEAQGTELSEKLQKLLPIYRRNRVHNVKMLCDRTDNRQIFWNIDRLDSAIKDRHKVSFSYLEYGFDKKLHPRREKPYTVNPYGLVYTNEHYYLVCNLSGYPNTSLYRIDFISDITILDENIDIRNDDSESVESAVYAFTGRPTLIKLKCDKRILKDVIDKFGLGVHIVKTGDDEFTASFTAAPSGVKFWALQYLPFCEVLEPISLRDEVIAAINGNRYGE